jgi:hypothetical protein
MAQTKHELLNWPEEGLARVEKLVASVNLLRQ